MANSDIYLTSAAEAVAYKLSAINRKFSEMKIVQSKTNRLFGGKKVRDQYAIKRKLSLEWTWLPDKDADVIDGGIGFDTLFNHFIIVDDAEGLLTVTYQNDGGGQYNMQGYIDISIGSDIIRRETNNTHNVYFRNVKFDIIER